MANQCGYSLLYVGLHTNTCVLEVVQKQPLFRPLCFVEFILENDITVKPEIKVAINFSISTNMSLLASINFGFYLVLSP